MAIAATDNEYPKATNATVFGALLSFIAGLLLLMSFASPYWIASYPEMFSSFKHMGLWEYCFDNFRYPYYQFPKLFTGCHYVFSQEFYVIREWLLPGWLMAVQALVTLAFMCSLAAQLTLALVLVRWPLRAILRYEWMATGFSCACAAAASFFLFLAVAVFGGNCYRRDWLMYPAFNVLSWSYAFAVVAFMIFGVAAFLLYVETKRSYESRREAKNLVMQMQLQEPQRAPSSQGGYPHHRSGYI